MSRVVHALVADDEAPARARIVALLARHARCHVVAECESGPSTLAAIETHGPDLVFLDVQMPGMSGIEVWRKLDPAVRPVVVFTTAFDQYALDAFEARAIDYLLKPYTDERFDEALGRAERLIRGDRLEDWEGRMRDLLAALGGDDAGVPAHAGYADRFAVREGERTVILPVAEVDWVEAARDYVRLHAGTSWHLLRTTMQRIERRLDPQCFIRVHRSAIVRVDRIVGVEPFVGGDDLLLLRNGAKVRVARHYRDAVRARLGMTDG